MSEDYPINYNSQLVSVAYNNNLTEHLDYLDTLRETFVEGGKAFREIRRYKN